MFEDTAHDTVAAAMNLYAHLLLVHGIGIVDSIGMYLAILQHYALGNLTKVGSGNVLVAIYVVNLLLEILGMCQFGSQITVVGEQEHTSGAAVQTTYGIYALAASVLHQVHNGLAVLGIIAGGNIVLGLVQQQIDLLLHVDGLVVEHNLVATLHLGTEFGNNNAIHLYHTCLDESICLATAAYTGIGEIAVQTYGFVWIVVLLLVLYLLLHAVLGMRIVALGTLLVAAGTVLVTTLAVVGA